MFRAFKLLTAPERAIRFARALVRSAPFLLLLPFGELPPLGPPPPLDGVGVLGPVDRSSFLAMSDIQAGDVLLSWSRFDRQERDRVVAHGRFDSPYDLVEMLVEQGPRGRIVLRGKRAGKPKVWTFSAGALSLDRWEARTVPAVAGFDRTRARVAYSLLLARDSEEGTRRLEDISSSVQDRDPRAGAWLFFESAQNPNIACERFDHLIERSSRLLARLGDPMPLAHEFRNGSYRIDPCMDQWVNGMQEQRTDIERRRWLTRYYDFQRKRGAVRRLVLRRILSVDRATHRQLAEARTLLALAGSALADAPTGKRRHRNLGLALARKAMSIVEKEAPASYDLVQAFARTSLQGPKGAEKYVQLQRRSLELLDNLSPTAREKASALASMGSAYRSLGQMDSAEFYLRLAIAQNPQEDLQKWSALSDLQGIYQARGDRDLEGLYRARVPNRHSSSDDAFLAGDIGRFNFLLRAGSWLLKPMLNSMFSGFRDTLANENPMCFSERESLRVSVKDSFEKEALLLKFVQEASRFNQGTLDPCFVGFSLDLAETQILLGKRREAFEQILTSLDELDRLDSALGGAPDSRASHEEQVQPMYRRAVLALLDAGYAIDAVEALDHGRGRELARQRRASSEAGVFQSPSVLELDRKIDLLTARLEGFDASSSKDSQQQLRAEIHDLRATRRLLGFATSNPPDSGPSKLSLSEIRAGLDPGSLLLYYVVGSHETYIFAVRRGGEPSLSIFHFPVESYVLTSRVKAFLNGIEANREPKESEANQLYDLLVLPVQSLIESSDRIAISAEGPLLSLPFSALRHNGRYLAEVKPIHRIASVATFKRVKEQRPQTSDPRRWNVVAFADPRYSVAGGSQDGVRDPALTRAVERGLSLAPLPASRVEVESLAKSFPSTRAFLGADASESNAREYSAFADVLHFACHGLLDSKSPYDSSLALAIPERTIPGRDNGLLQAWEVGERLSLKAELVTLSACKTALGDAGSGEGLLGMSWAFQAAGARSVVASTWSVSDRETAELMKRFYRHLSEGLPKDEALRSAQAEMIHSGDTALAAPAAWAGFELFGDWR